MTTPLRYLVVTVATLIGATQGAARAESPKPPAPVWLRSLSGSAFFLSGGVADLERPSGQVGDLSILETGFEVQVLGWGQSQLRVFGGWSVVGGEVEDGDDGGSGRAIGNPLLGISGVMEQGNFYVGISLSASPNLARHSGGQGELEWASTAMWAAMHPGKWVTSSNGWPGGAGRVSADLLWRNGYAFFQVEPLLEFATGGPFTNISAHLGAATGVTSKFASVMIELWGGYKLDGYPFAEQDRVLAIRASAPIHTGLISWAPWYARALGDSYNEWTYDSWGVVAQVSW